MDDLIVIILTILILVLGAIGQIKKKKPVQNNTQQKNNTGDFWDWLEGEPEMTGHQPEYTPHTAEPVPAEPAPKETITEETEYTFTPSNEGKSESMGRTNTIKQPPIVREEKRTKINDMKEFSLRKAIIYSEIINRKYT